MGYNNQSVAVEVRAPVVIGKVPANASLGATPGAGGSMLVQYRIHLQIYHCANKKPRMGARVTTICQVPALALTHVSRMRGTGHGRTRTDDAVAALGQHREAERQSPTQSRR